MGGYTNRVLRVDLAGRTCHEEQLDEKLIGGRGFGARWLYGDLEPGIDPLSDENELIFVAGPLAGTSAQSFGRWNVFFKSPLTGTFFNSSG